MRGWVVWAALATLAVGASAGGGTGAAARPWFERSLVGMEVGPTGAQFGGSDRADRRYCQDFDGRQVVRRAVAAGSEYVVLWARDGDYAYYQSKLLPAAPGLGARDPLREAVAEARRRRVPLIAYCVVQQGGHYLQAHPEFEMRGADGRRLGRFCYNSGYLEAMKAITSEQLAYGIDGFHIDMVDQGFGAPYGCWCDRCRALFAAEFGHAMPAGAAGWDAGWDEVLEFRYRTSERFEKALRAHIRSVNPAATVDYNYHGNPPFSFEVGQRPVQHAGNADFVTGETGQWGFSALGVGLNAEFYRASTPGLPFQVAMQRGVRMYHDQTTRPLEDIRWELFTLLAHGAFVTMVDKTGLEGRLDLAAYERIGAAFAGARARRAHFGQAPLYDVGIYFSARCRDWLGRENPAAYFQGFQGVQKACAYGHLTYGVLLNESLSAASLGRFPVVCLPGAGILSERETGLFRQYVEQGGKLVVLGQSGLFDARGAPLAETALAGLIGARLVRRLDSTDNWVRLDGRAGPALGAGARPGQTFLVRGPGVAYAPTTATPIGTLLAPSRTTRQREGREPVGDWPMSAEAPVGPAALLHRVGRGTVLTWACSPDFATASEHHTVEARSLLTRAIRMLRPNPPVSVTAPANVESVVTVDPHTRTIRVHLLAYNSLPQTTPATNRPFILPGLMEESPIYRATVRLRSAPVKVSALSPATRLKCAGRTVSATINETHEALVIRY